MYVVGMSLLHPSTEELSLPILLSALADETRLAIVGCLASDQAGGGLVCKQLGSLGSKTNLSYHVNKLREGGVIKVLPEGTSRVLSLRRADLELRFPGFLDAVIAGAVILPQVVELLQELAPAREPAAI